MQEVLVDVEKTLKELEEREDMNGDQQITIDDDGPKVSPATVCEYCV